MTKKLYAAYGSNINQAQMSYRCPGARIFAQGRISNYRLVFQGTRGSSFANVIPCEGHCVPVLIWELDKEHERSLDRYEGYPKMYKKEDLLVSFLKGEERPVMVYVMTEARPLLGVPSTSYYEGIAEGYRACEMDSSILTEALELSLQEEKGYS